VYQSHTLGSPAQRCSGQKEIIVHQNRSMSHFDKQIHAKSHAIVFHRKKFRQEVVMKQILGDSGSLGLPVCPNPHGAVVNVISSENHINCRMEFNSCHFSPGQLLHVVNMMNVVVFNNRKDTAHTPYNSRLSAVVDMAAAHNMRTHSFFGPAVILGNTYRIPFHLGRAFHMFAGKIIVILLLCLMIISQRNPAALAVGNVTVLNNPALAPVRANHTVLIGSRRRPVRRCLANLKSA